MRKMSWRDRAAQHIQENMSLYLFVSVLLLMGVIFGAVLVNSLQDSQKQDLYFYLNRFFGQVSEGKFADGGEMFRQSYFSHLKYIGFLWILGISIIGLPIIFILLFAKGVMVGFTVGFLVHQLGWNGFLLAFVSVLPQNLIMIPAVIVMTTIAVSFSLRMIRHQFIRRLHEPLLPLFARYTICFCIVGLAAALASGVEAYMSPALMKNVIEVIKQK
ncbi:stage II sporulation protein M [Ectobacillus ponti]|uniref:Stage II sporulation protein M n=1 Tax=Ectobacillus ponti TaxID=2961894 RepID=A0AA41X4D6_9BACI|nr:stage II sporulation protein M [Ectobacillus ponti]MCP8966963.1 stage II sporulation protein M [Ectobacillus ponti]